MIMNSMYQLTQEYLWLIESVIEKEGVLDPEDDKDLIEALGINEENFKEKMLAYCHVIENIKAEIAGAKLEIERISAFANARENTIESLKKQLLFGLENFGTKNKTGGIQMTLDNFRIHRGSSTRTEIDPLKFNEEYKKIQLPPLDKKTIEIIKKALPQVLLGYQEKVVIPSVTDIDNLIVNIKNQKDALIAEGKEDEAKAIPDVEGVKKISGHHVVIK